MSILQRTSLTARLTLLLVALVSAGCSAPKEPPSPLETLKDYGNAYKKKDYVSMKLLLSDASLKMVDQEAKAQGLNTEEVLKRENLFSDAQRSAEFRNLKVEDEKASVDMKDALGMWTTVYFVKERGEWKIDKKALADELIRQSEESLRQLDSLINANR